MKIKYIDLFSGIGGFALGLQKAGIEFDRHYFSEIDKNAISVYKRHFPSAEELGDVTTIRDVSGLSADLITFGFPCQDLSSAGKRKGLAGARSGLFFEAMRIIRQVKPRYFIFENVKGLFTSDRGADFIRCLREIADIGLYDCEWQLVNTCWILPQKRERIYFIGHLRGESFPKVFPIEKKATGNSEFIKKARRNLNIRPVCDITSAKKLQNGRMMGDKYAFTLTTCNMQGVWDGENLRFLTPQEKERLQGFPDGWTAAGKDGEEMSDTARGKLIGRAVTVDIVQLIAMKLFG